MRKSGSIGIINNKILKRKNSFSSPKWFYLHSIEKEDSSLANMDCWSLKHQFFDCGDNSSNNNKNNFNCVILLTDERVKPKKLRYKYTNTLTNQRMFDNNNYYRKALLTINGINRIIFVSEKNFNLFSWSKNNSIDKLPLFKKVLSN